MAKSTRLPNPVDVHVGSRIRLRRKMLGVSQQKLGEGLGVTFQQVQKYEKGTNRVGSSRLKSIAGILGVSVGFFFEDAPEGDTVPAAAGDISAAGTEQSLIEYLASNEGLELNRHFVMISDPNLRKKVIDLVRAIAIGTHRA